MKKGILAIFLVLLLSGCNFPLTTAPANTPTATVGISSEIPFQTETMQPVETTPPAVEATATQSSEGTAYSQNGISFNLPTCLASDAAISTVPAVPVDPNGMTTQTYPEHRLIQFVNYPLIGKFFDAKVAIYPVAEFLQLQPGLESEVQPLKSMLAAHPEVLPGKLPFLPPQMAQQVFHARESYLEFQNGSGIAYLSEFAQYSAPANNHDLFYTYQAITNDGKYWISAILPVSANFVQDTPNSNEVPQNGIPVFTDPTDVTAVKEYYAAVTALMKSVEASAYTPEITCLDVFLQSLKVENP